MLVEQFNQYEPVAGARVDGIRTLRENIGDLAGLAVAYAAYQLSLRGRPSPVIDGLTGDERLLMAWARVWRSKERDEYLRQWVISVPHSPAKFRVNGIAAHVAAFYRAFDVKAGDALFREPDRRVTHLVTRSGRRRQLSHAQSLVLKAQVDPVGPFRTVSGRTPLTFGYWALVSSLLDAPVEGGMRGRDAARPFSVVRNPGVTWRRG